MIIAGTGHRPDKLGGYSPEVSSRLQRFAESQLAKLRPTAVITGMALGWDQALGWAAKSQKIPFWAYVPFEGQESVWPEPAQEQYIELLSYADKIEVCSPGGYSAPKMHTRNMRMVDDCEMLLALYNGTDGGTANCVRYAESKRRIVYNCWNDWKKPGNALCLSR